MYIIKMSDWNQNIPPCQDKIELAQRLSDVLGVGYFYQFIVKKDNNKVKTIHGVNELVEHVLKNENEVEIIDKLLSYNTGSFILKILSHKQHELFD